MQLAFSSQMALTVVPGPVTTTFLQSAPSASTVGHLPSMQVPFWHRVVTSLQSPPGATQFTRTHVPPDVSQASPLSHTTKPLQLAPSPTTEGCAHLPSTHPSGAPQGRPNGDVVSQASPSAAG